MVGEGRRVLVVEHDPDMAELVEAILRQEGYEAESLLDQPGLLEGVRRFSPDLLIVDLRVASPERGYQLLDELRADPQTSSVPVLVMTTGEDLAESTIASYNVKATLVKPFGLPDLLARVREALDQPPLPAVPPPEVAERAGVLQLAERILAERSRDILVRWAQRLRQEQPWQAHRDLRLSTFYDSVPLIVQAIVAALEYGNPDEFISSHPALLRGAREHAANRRNLGIPLAAVVREYVTLRDEIWGVCRRYLPADMSMDDVFKLVRAVSLTLDRIVESTIPAYLEGSDRKSA